MSAPSYAVTEGPSLFDRAAPQGTPPPMQFVAPPAPMSQSTVAGQQAPQVAFVGGTFGPVYQNPTPSIAVNAPLGSSPYLRVGEGLLDMPRPYVSSRCAVGRINPARLLTTIPKFGCPPAPAGQATSPDRAPGSDPTGMVVFGLGILAVSALLYATVSLDGRAPAKRPHVEPETLRHFGKSR